MTTITGTDQLLLDATIWVGAKEPKSPYFGACRALVAEYAPRVAALDLTMYEVANVLGARDRRAEEAFDMCRLMTARCGEAMVTADPSLISSTLGIALEHGLTAYDASYVAVARREGWTLVSLDVKDLVSKGLAVTPDAAV